MVASRNIGVESPDVALFDLIEAFFDFADLWLCAWTAFTSAGSGADEGPRRVLPTGGGLDDVCCPGTGRCA
jgi:hypothetical protein